MTRSRRRHPLRALAAIAVALLLPALVGCAPNSGAETLTFRLWDPQAAKSYTASFAEFTRQTGIAVDVQVVPWADYFTQLRADLASGTEADVFWTNAGNFIEYADAGLLLDITASLGSRAESAWSAPVVAQYTKDGKLWGVPQLTDPGIGIVYNAKLLEAAGLDPDAVQALSWDPTAPDDSLRRIARRLTLDSAGRTPDDPRFDPSRVVSYGYGASNDLNAVLLPFLGSAGAAWQDGDRFVFADGAGPAAIGYVVDLIGKEHVAPPAADTNPPAGSDTDLDLFLRGRLALFQTGAYNLANIRESADFPWGIAPLPSGPAGAISVTNGVIAAASSRSHAPEAQRRLLEWIGSARGASYLGADGSALPAVTAAQQSYFDFWTRDGIDVSPLMKVLENGTVQAPQGARYSAAEAAYDPILNDVFTRRTPVSDGLKRAQAAANAAMAGGG